MDTIVFDKTGTLTNGVFEVTAVLPSTDAEHIKTELEAATAECEILGLAAELERFSTHPIAESIVSAHERRQGETQTSNIKITDIEEIAGHGISGKFSGKEILAGNYKLMREKQISCKEQSGSGTVVYVAYDGKYLGCIIISDIIKEGAKKALVDLKKAGVSKTVMLTGDRKETALAVANEVGVDEVHFELLPADKVSQIEVLLEKSTDKKKVAFVGDGINDAPVLARADIGFAMGSLGSDAAIEAADIVIMDDDIRKIAKVMKISRKTMTIVKQNIVFALGVKGLILVLGAVGMASMWAAVFADVGVAVIAILNSMRTLRK